MADQREEGVRKGAHCAGQIHDHMVFPVKYRQALRDEVVTTIIQETAAEIAERFPLERDAIGTDQHHIPLLGSAHPNVAPGRMGHMFTRLTAREIFRRKPAVKRVLWGGEFWSDGYLCGDGGSASQLADRRTVCTAARAAPRRSPTDPTVLVL